MVTPASRRTALLLAAPAILLAVAVLLPFHDKAFTIDDTLFLEQARHALVDPLHPTAFETVWSEAFPVRVSRIMPSGPVMSWLLLPSVRAGGAEWLAHLVQFGMLALGLYATVALALRLGLAPRWAAASGLLLAATPAVLGMAGTAMPDVPSMALGVAGIERLAAWKQDRRIHQAVFAAILLGLATLSRSHLILLLGPGALLLVDGDVSRLSTWRRAPSGLWIPFALAPLATFAILLLTRDPAPGTAPMVGAMARFITYKRLPANLTAFAIHWVLALPLAIPWIVLRPAMLRRRWWVILAAVAFALWLFWLDDQGLRFPLAVVGALGVVVLWDILADAWRRRDGTQLALGLWLLLALPVATYVHLPSKYLVGSAPAAAILVARALAAHGGRRAGLVLGGTMVLGVLLGSAILRADAAFASLGRRAAAEWIAPHVAAGDRVWFAGHWGFQWYAERAGARSLTSTPPYPVEGDYAVSSKRAMGQDIDMYPRRTRLARLADDTPGGRVMTQELDAGFFSNGWGYMPWAWGDVVLDELILGRLDQSSPTLPVTVEQR